MHVGSVSDFFSARPSACLKQVRRSVVMLVHRRNKTCQSVYYSLIEQAIMFSMCFHPSYNCLLKSWKKEGERLIM